MKWCEIKTKPKRTHERQSPIILNYSPALSHAEPITVFPAEIFHVNLWLSEQLVFGTFIQVGINFHPCSSEMFGDEGSSWQEF